MKLPITNKMPGGSDTQKMLRQAVFLKAKSLGGIAEAGHFIDAIS
jgi:hypothetical protein